MFAAALGYSLGVRTPLEKKGSAIRLDVFEKALDDAYVGALAAAEAKSLQLLAADREDDRATIFEEYAHRGLAEIQRRCFDTPGDPLQILIQIAEERGRSGDAAVVGVDPAVLKNLVG
jgi:dnd system-associated protein 4